MRLLEDGALPKQTTKKVAEASRRRYRSLKVLGVLRRDIPREFFYATEQSKPAVPGILGK